MDFIEIFGARTHNLRNIDLRLPRNALTVITGVSGSGKSSLAFDTLYAEGQRRYVESLSTYARQFLSVMDKPDVDDIRGLSPAISIQQNAGSHNPRSTVGTITEIHDHLRLLYARAGIPRCPEHGLDLIAHTVSGIVDHLLGLPEGLRVMLLAPVGDRPRSTTASPSDVVTADDPLTLVQSLRARGLVRACVDGALVDLDDHVTLERLLTLAADAPRIEAVVDRFRLRAGLRERLADSVETAITLGDGRVRVVSMDADVALSLVFTTRHACSVCGYSVPTLEPRLFSFNNPDGACSGCDGLGSVRFFDPERVISNPTLSLAGGAIRGWDRRNAYYFRMIQSLAAHYGFDPEAPFESLPEATRRVLLHGSGTELIAFEHMQSDGRRLRRRDVFEGVLPSLERRYRETDLPAVREELGKLVGVRECPECGGTRLSRMARHVYVGDRPLPAVLAMTIAECLAHVEALVLDGARGVVAGRILNEIRTRLRFLIDVGLDYLSLDRSAGTLSGGEAQRIRLASQIGAGLVGVLYVLDEPSIGLHQRDNDRLLDTLRCLRDMGNTVVVVEHDEDAMRAADHLLDMGPGAGVRGGQVVASGTVAQVMATTGSLTGDYLSGRRRIRQPAVRRPAGKRGWLSIRDAHGHTLRHVDVDIPVGLLVCVTGVSGSGKSTLVNDTLYRFAAGVLNRANADPAPVRAIEGLEQFDKVVNIDQGAIGRTPRSNPATYTGLFNGIRELFAGTPEARARGYGPGRFSFNVKGGRCEACQGDGVVRVEMHFLPDVYVACDVCAGRRYNRETLEVTYKGLSIHQVLELPVEEALGLFAAIPALHGKLQTLLDVGLGYVRLGQSATTLSGGEAQRIKLSRELSRRQTGNTLYILDEPTTGLHFHDIDLLLGVLQRLCDAGNTVVVIEHNLDVIRAADWLIDLGPEGGHRGGQVVAAGTPEQVALVPASHTGRYLWRATER
jgi:excinuclease ABC subunit A